MADIFISYARPDRPFVERLSACITGAGYSVWWDHALIAGAQFSEEIERELTKATSVIVIWSPDSVRSTWVRSEADMAAQRGVLIPLKRGAVEPPLPHKLLHTLDFTAWLGKGEDDPYPQLLKAIGLLRLRSRESYVSAIIASSEGRVDAADQLLKIIRSGGDYSEPARLDFAHYEFARLGDHGVLPTLMKLRRNSTDSFVTYGLNLMIGLCRMASGELPEAIQELAECRAMSETHCESRVKVALHEVLAFGAINETKKLESAWAVLTQSAVTSKVSASNPIPWESTRPHDKAVIAVLYGDQEVRTVAHGLQGLHRQLIHLAAANSRLARKSTPVLSELVTRAKIDQWKRQPNVAQLRRRLRHFERELLPTAGTLFPCRRS